MVDLAKLAKTVQTVVEKQGPKIATGVDKATDFVDKKTGGKHHDKLEKLSGMAQKLDKSGDRTGGVADSASPVTGDPTIPAEPSTPGEPPPAATEPSAADPGEPPVTTQ